MYAMRRRLLTRPAAAVLMTALVTAAVFVVGYLLLLNLAPGANSNIFKYVFGFVLPAFFASFFVGWLVARYARVPVLPTLLGLPLALLVLMLLSPLFIEAGG